MKKIISLTLALLLMVSVFAGCSSNTSSSAVAPEAGETETVEPVTITYWQHSSAARDEMITKIVADFEAQNPDIKVKCEFIPQDDYTQKLIPSLATATAPDVFQIQSGMVSKLAQAEAIQALDETVMPTAEIAEKFIAATVDGLKYDGKYYGMPTDTQTMICYWNKDLAEQAGLDAENGPQTWEEFFEWARVLTVKDSSGALVQSGWASTGYWPEVASYVEQMGGKMYDESTGKFVFADDAKAVEAISNMASLYRDDKVYNTEFSKTWAGFRQGLVGVMLGHPAMLGNLPTTAPDLDFGVALIPANGTSRATCVTSWAYVMSSKAPSEAATRFVEYLGSEEVQKQWTLTTGELPAHKSLLDDAEILANEKGAIAVESLKDSFVGRLQTSALNTIWSNSYERILIANEDIQTVLTDCQNQLNAELESDI